MTIFYGYKNYFKEIYMKNLNKKLALGAVITGLLATSAMAQKGKYFYGDGYGNTPSHAKADAKDSARMVCDSRGGFYKFSTSEPRKLDNGSWKVTYRGNCNEY
jgi:hypothetical protein